jgi:hypothetical protein
MTDKIDTLFSNIDDSLNEYSSTAQDFAKKINVDIQQLNNTITTENVKINEELKKYKPVEVFPVAGGNNIKTFLAPIQLRDTYKRIKMTGGSRQDINNMIYTIEKMQRMGINRDFFPVLLQRLKVKK